MASDTCTRCDGKGLDTPAKWVTCLCDWCEIIRLRAALETAEMALSGKTMHDAADEERARIVAWLRRGLPVARLPGRQHLVGDDIADWVERGDHRKGADAVALLAEITEAGYLRGDHSIKK